jgi:hypothetical protein
MGIKREPLTGYQFDLSCVLAGRELSSSSRSLATTFLAFFASTSLSLGGFDVSIRKIRHKRPLADTIKDLHTGRFNQARQV